MSISLDAARLRSRRRLLSAHGRWFAEWHRLTDALFESVTLAKSKRIAIAHGYVAHRLENQRAMRTSMDLHHHSDQDLLTDATKLVGSQRELTAKLAVYLAEIEDRRLHLLAGYSSMFEFCTKELKLSEAEAFRRLLAARLGRSFPVVYTLLASGAVNLSALELVRERLTVQNHAELLEAVSWKSKHAIQELLAARFPKPDSPSKIRKLPVEPVQRSFTDSSVDVTREPLSRVNQARARARIEPLSKARYRVEFTASAGLREKLELCRDLMSHANPSRDLETLVERAVDLLLAELQRKRLGQTKRPRSASGPPAGKPGRVTTGVRRRVFERDGTRCTYVSDEGRRCSARAFLELDHAEPRGHGGGDEAENLRVRCRAHNQLWAEQTYGREHVEHRRRFRQQKYDRRRLEGELHVAPTTNEPASDTLRKVYLVLRSMGFRDAEVRTAIAAAERHGEARTVEEVLREALLVATAKCA